MWNRQRTSSSYSAKKRFSEKRNTQYLTKESNIRISKTQAVVSSTGMALPPTAGGCVRLARAVASASAVSASTAAPTTTARASATACASAFACNPASKNRPSCVAGDMYIFHEIMKNINNSKIFHKNEAKMLYNLQNCTI